jgi:hypothetical protein
MADEKRLESLKAEYDFRVYEEADTMQPALFDIDLPDDDHQPGALSFDAVRRREALAMQAFRERALNLPYFETFLDLLDGQWPPRIAAFIAWASSPRLDRVPATQEELAHMLGLTSDRQFSKWRRQYPSIDTLIAKLQIGPLLKHRADVFQALAESASNPDYKHNPDRKLFAEITGDYVPSAKFEAELKRSGDGSFEKQPDAVLEKIVGPVNGDE